MNKKIEKIVPKTTNLELQNLLKRAYIKLADCDDVCKGNDFFY